MDINVRGKNMEVTDALKDYAQKRIGKLEKYLEGFGIAQVKMEVKKDRHKVEVTVPINGMILRGEEATGDMYASIDLVVDKLEKQIEKYKGKLCEKRLARSAGAKTVVAAATEQQKNEPQIVKTKRFAMKPMVVEEAVMQMNMLGHSFFVFFDADTEQVNVVYMRKDGNYGLIEPSF